MSQVKTLEELIKKYLGDVPLIGQADTYDLYKHKKGLDDAKSYSDAMTSLYLKSKQGSPSFGTSNRIINNKGLQNSGYSDYVGSLIENKFKSDADELKDSYKQSEEKSRSSYASYLEAYADKKNRVKKSVMTHLADNDITDMTTAIAYGMSAGLSKEDAEAVGKGAYEIVKKKVFDSILDKSGSLGLDKEGARLLAVKFGLSDEDAKAISEEVSEFLKYYKNISEDYLEFLEQRGK